ncbi:MAG: hypothetical protein EHM33_30680, partial [Chloroflexi bacterium]
LPVEIETELGPGSLKQSPLWKETIQLLKNPYGTVERRPGFGVSMPPLNVMPLDLNFLTDQPLRLRTSDGEISWDQPGPLFDPEQSVAQLDTDGNGTPDILRNAIGALVASEDDVLDQADLDRLGNLTREIQGYESCPTCGYLIVSNPTGHPAIPPDGTIVAVPAMVNGELQELVAPGSTETEAISELEIPVNEEDFFRPQSQQRSQVPIALRPYMGRLGAEVLGKALFWDMQVGSDGVQSCGTCHFSAGADIRTKNQLNPNSLGGDTSSLDIAGPNEDVEASDFPFHQLANPDMPGEPLLNPGNEVSDSNDVMSSMGVRFRQFDDIRPIGSASFGSAFKGVRPLRPDIGTEVADPIPVFQDLRRVEPRNTPTMISAAFNFDNFWDGRARFNFNGGSVFGPSDPQFHIFIDPGGANGGPAVNLQGATNGHIRPELSIENPDMAGQPVRIKFSSLASQATGPVLSDFEMSYAGRNWQKVAKKLLQARVVPLANQLVATDDSRLGPFSNQGGSVCTALSRPTVNGRPGLCVSYEELIQLSFNRTLWQNTNRRLVGCFTDGRTPACPAGTEPDPFDGYVLRIANGAASPTNRNQFRQIEANFSLFFGLSVQAYEQLLIPDDTPFDQFMDANPLAANAVAQPGEQGTLPPSEVAALVGTLTLIPDDPSTPYYDGFGPDEIYGFDIFAGSNLTAALPVGSARNPDGVGSNPFLRTARCMLCHIGPEQTDHSVNISHGLIKGLAEYELPIPYLSPEPTGPFAFVPGLILAEEIGETAQDVIEVEPRDMGVVD